MCFENIGKFPGMSVMKIKMTFFGRTVTLLKLSSCHIILSQKYY